jgi:hypothetical protein
MCEFELLCDRSTELESKLRDLDCTTVEVSLAAARLLLEEVLNDDSQDMAAVENCRLALAGAVVIAEAVIEQFSTRPHVYALDGDIQFGPYSYAPGKMCADLRSAIVAAEREARDQRDAILSPVVRALIVERQNDTLAELGIQ